MEPIENLPCPERGHLCGGASGIGSSGTRADAAGVWLPDLVERIGAFLGPNDTACLRGVNKTAFELFRQHTMVTLSSPAPRWAFEERWGAPDACKQLTRSERALLLSLVARSDDPRNLRVAIAAADMRPSDTTLEAALSSGALECCNWLVDSGAAERVWSDDRFKRGTMLSAAARSGQRRACKWCFRHCPALTVVLKTREENEIWQVAVEAGVAGHLAIVEWLLAEAAAAGCQGDWLNLCCAALRGCDFATAKRLWGIYAPPLHQMEPAALQQAAPQQAALQQAAPQQGGAGGDGGPPAAGEFGFGPAPLPPADPASDLLVALEAALSSPTPDWRAKAEWLTSLGAEPRPVSFYVAACWGLMSGPEAIERFEWLLARGCQTDPLDECHGMALDGAISNGQVEVARWLLEHDPPAQDMGDLGGSAARAGQVQMLQALQQAGYPLHDDPCLFEAARGGQVEALQWVEDNIPADEDGPGYGEGLLSTEQTYDTPFTAAAHCGSLDAMRWLRAGGRGHAMEAIAWVAAVDSGCGAALEALAELGCPMPTDGSPYAVAIKLQEWRLLTLLGRLGVPLGPNRGAPLMAAALHEAPVDALQGLAAAGCRANWKELARKVGAPQGYHRGERVLTWLRAQPAAAEIVAEAKLAEAARKRWKEEVDG